MLRSMQTLQILREAPIRAEPTIVHVPDQRPYQSPRDNVLRRINELLLQTASLYNNLLVAVILVKRIEMIEVEGIELRPEGFVDNVVVVQIIDEAICNEAECHIPLGIAPAFDRALEFRDLRIVQELLLIRTRHSGSFGGRRVIHNIPPIDLVELNGLCDPFEIGGAAARRNNRKGGHS